MIVLDVAHNEDGIKQLLKQIQTCVYEKLHIVFGMVKDKDVDKILSLLPQKATYYFTKAQIPRALPEDELRVKGDKYNLIGASFSEVNIALKTATEKALPDDLIIVCGSVFVVGEVEI
jgi:dihydrofolate synthase/folylpolyglutamate synthase